MEPISSFLIPFHYILSDRKAKLIEIPFYFTFSINSNKADGESYAD